MKQRVVFILVFLISVLAVSAQTHYWIAFSDKNNNSHSLAAPEDYLSERAIQRRAQQNIPIDSLDLPVNQNYIDSVLTLDVTLVHATKWLNGITVKTTLEGLEDTLMNWSFVRYVQKTKPGPVVKSASRKFEDEAVLNEVPIDTSLYGESVHQVSMLKGQFLHEKGYKGKGLVIAVLDAGFYKADEYPAFDTLWTDDRILGTRDFVNPASDIFSTHYHGMSVLSCMGGNIPGQLIGTAPDASYWLLRSEDALSEYIIEEDNWVVAAEFADSVGADVINSSLGYYTFDDPSTSHQYADMDGRTTRVTRAANIAASKGMLVFASAGNERDNSWFRIIAPSDGEKVIGVGAVGADLVPAYFTSAGPAADGAVKPNVAAMGYRAIAQMSSGSVGQINGTSFSSPILAGMATSLWQMFPEKTSAEIKEAIEMSASKYSSPDTLIGYGIPDMQVAAGLLGYQSVNPDHLTGNWKVYPNPVKDRMLIQTDITSHEIFRIQLISADGIAVKNWERTAFRTIEIDDLDGISNGIYFVRITTKSQSESIKISKLD